jgi:hypothetical protein
MVALSLHVGHLTSFRAIASCYRWENFAQSLNGFTVPDRAIVVQCGIPAKNHETFFTTATPAMKLSQLASGSQPGMEFYRQGEAVATMARNLSNNKSTN